MGIVDPTTMKGWADSFYNHEGVDMIQRDGHGISFHNKGAGDCILSPKGVGQIIS